MFHPVWPWSPTRATCRPFFFFLMDPAPPEFSPFPLPAAFRIGVRARRVELFVAVVAPHVPGSAAQMPVAPRLPQASRGGAKLVIVTRRQLELLALRQTDQ